MKELYLCIDFEMLCNESGMLNKSGTIIEIGACLVRDNKVIDRFSTYVKPQGKTPMNDFTSSFLSISKDTFDKDSISFTEAMQLFDDWSLPYLNQIIGWVTWDDKDLKKLNESFAITKSKRPAALRQCFIDAQVGYCRKNYVFERISLNEALYQSDVNHSYGTHKALDDALKLSLILPYSLGR